MDDFDDFGDDGDDGDDGDHGAGRLPHLRPDGRPRLRPRAVLLDLPGGELQVGLAPAWRVPDPTGRWRRLLSRADGRRPWLQLLAESEDQRAVVRLLATLAESGLVDLDLEPAPSAPPVRPRTVRVLGSGPLAAAIADRLRLAGAEQADEDGDEDESAATPALTIVVANTLEVDRAVVLDLLRHDRAHLLVRPDPEGAVVGPLVVPGQTSCLDCADLRRRDADPAWPTLLPQLTRTRVDSCPPAATDWAVALTVTQTMGFLAGERPETWGATLELSGYAMAWRPWRTHPECGCRWAG